MDDIGRYICSSADGCLHGSSEHVPILPRNGVCLHYEVHTVGPVGKGGRCCDRQFYCYRAHQWWQCMPVPEEEQ